MPVEICLNARCDRGLPVGSLQRWQPQMQHGFQRGELEWLGDVVVHARFEAAVAIASDGVGGQRDDR